MSVSALESDVERRRYFEATAAAMEQGYKAGRAYEPPPTAKVKRTRKRASKP